MTDFIMTYRTHTLSDSTLSTFMHNIYSSVSLVRTVVWLHSFKSNHHDFSHDARSPDHNLKLLIAH